jgi:alcohol dehydrogenase class IV
MFEIQIPAILRIGGGCVAELVGVLQHLGCERPLIVTDPFLQCSGLPDRTAAALVVSGIPTTAGTGSEVTRFTIIRDSLTGEKMLIAGPTLLPTAALVDFELTLSMPSRLTADTGRILPDRAPSSPVDA